MTGTGETSPHQGDASLLWQRLQSKHPYPLTIQAVVTEHCHLQCQHCYITEHTGAEDRLTLLEYERCFDEWAELGVLRLVLTGGEPTLRKDLLSIVSAAGSRHFYTQLKTSGTRFSDDDIPAYWDAGLSKLEVSLYHTVPEKHDAFVGLPGAFEKMFHAITAFKKVGGSVHVNVLAMNWNVDVLDEMIDLCEAHDFDCNVDPNVFTRQDAGAEPLKLRLSEASLVPYMKNIAPRLGYENSLPGKKDARLPICGVGRGAIQINPNGDAVLCDRLRCWVMGNVRETSLRDIWLNSPIRQKVLNMKWGDLSPCGTCDLASVCSHCPGEALKVMGDIKSMVPYECAMTRASVEAAASAKNNVSNS